MENRMDSDYDEIVQGFADACFVFAWAQAWEERGDGPPWEPGARIEDCVPSTPSMVVLWAGERLKELCDVDLVQVFHQNAELPGHACEPDPHTFGWYLATQWLGIGVRWSDSHPDHGLLKGAYGECYAELEEDPAYVYIYGTGGLDAYITLTGDAACT